MVSYEEVITDFRQKVRSVFAQYQVAITKPNPAIPESEMLDEDNVKTEED